MKKITLFGAACLLLAACSTPGQMKIGLSNPSAFERKAEVVELPWDSVLAKYPKMDTTQLKVTDAVTGKELLYQIEYKGEKSPVNLLVQVDIPASGTTTIALEKGKPAAAAPLTYGRYVPERLDDFAWENDRIAFRMYGKALETTPKDNAYGVDVWSKRTPALIINKWYKTGDYHKDNGDGLDYYKVGRTLGAGDIAPYTADSIWFPLNYRTWKVLDNGPLRTTFELGYEPWNVNGRTVKAVKRISLDAGSSLNKAAVTYETSDKNPLDVITGITKRPEAGGNTVTDEAIGLTAYEEPAHGEDGVIFLATLAAKKAETAEFKQHLATKMQAESGKPLVYYFGAAWNKAGYFSSNEAWANYVRNFYQRSQEPIQIKF
ncbi:MAG: DUF4861 family protein [Chitinophagaceae bacterium]